MTDSVDTDALRGIAEREDRESDTFIDGDIADERYWELREVADALITAADEIDALRARLSALEEDQDGLVDQHVLVRARARAERAEALVADLRSNPRDGYHTMAELYDYRMLYNALAFNEWAASNTYPVVKSWRHSDGEPCFGGGWFIVVASTEFGQISNHYEAEHWDLFQIPESIPPTYDGHTPAEAAERMRAILSRASQPASEVAGPCREDVPGTVPSWAGEDQIDPCRCVLPSGHDGPHECAHKQPASEVEQ